MSDKKYILTGDDARSEKEPERLAHSEQYLADLFTEQVNTMYQIPREKWKRKEVYFNPSGVDKCMRELFYENTNAEADDMELVAWRERMSRNGTGVHDATQKDYEQMEARLKKAGKQVNFRFIESEFKGNRTYEVNGYKVTLKGRADGKLGLLDENGEISRVIGWEKKTKDKRKNLNKQMKEGIPQESHKLQAVAYALIWGIKDWIFEYESLQKPDWSDVEPDKPDLKHFFVTVTREEAKALLIRLAKVVQAIEENELPDCEFSKCGFCPFKKQCNRDGGYKF